MDDHGLTLVACTAMHTRLLESSCVARFHRATSETARFVPSLSACVGCSVGALRAGELVVIRERRQPTATERTRARLDARRASIVEFIESCEGWVHPTDVYAHVEQSGDRSTPSAIRKDLWCLVKARRLVRGKYAGYYAPRNERPADEMAPVDIALTRAEGTSRVAAAAQWAESVGEFRPAQMVAALRSMGAPMPHSVESAHKIIGGIIRRSGCVRVGPARYRFNGQRSLIALVPVFSSVNTTKLLTATPSVCSSRRARQVELF